MLPRNHTFLNHTFLISPQISNNSSSILTLQLTLSPNSPRKTEVRKRTSTHLHHIFLMWILPQLNAHVPPRSVAVPVHPFSLTQRSQDSDSRVPHHLSITLKYHLHIPDSRVYFSPGLLPQLETWKYNCLINISTCIFNKHCLELLNFPLRLTLPEGFRLSINRNFILSVVQAKSQVIFDSLYLLLNYASSPFKKSPESNHFFPFHCHHSSPSHYYLLPNIAWEHLTGLPGSIPALHVYCQYCSQNDHVKM